MKKVMFLGGAAQQVPAIQYAKEQGYYTVLCDYLEDNPGRFYSDEFHCISTTDKEAVLDVAKKANIDGIVAFAADSGAPTAAFVGNILNLPSNPYESILQLTTKDLFREYLATNGFNCPNAKSFSSPIEAEKRLDEFQFPLMIKPVDSSGSKGISRIDSKDQLEFAFNYAIANSKKEMVIIEEYIQMSHECIIGGDLVVINGEIDFICLINGYRNIESNSFVPFGNSYPVFLGESKQLLVKEKMQRLIDDLGIKMGVINIEVVFDEYDKPFIVEVNPRNGGNMISELIKTATGVDLVKVTVEMALNNTDFDMTSTAGDMYCSVYHLHSFEKGILKSITFKDEIQENIIKKVFNKEFGEEIEVFDGLNEAIGFILLKYSSFEELKYKMKNMDRYIDIQMIS